jgi:hypothetical protein
LIRTEKEKKKRRVCFVGRVDRAHALTSTLVRRQGCCA